MQIAPFCSVLSHIAILVVLCERMRLIMLSLNKEADTVIKISLLSCFQFCLLEVCMCYKV